MTRQTGITSASDGGSVATDAALLQCCVDGDVSGWTALYDLCQAPLQSAIRSVLGSRARDRELVEELTAQVWYALVDQDAALLASFQVDRACRLATYVAAIGRNLVRNYLRAERRRRLREAGLATGRSEARPPDSDGFGLLTEELRATLTAREDGFFNWCLSPPPTQDGTYSGSENTDHQLRFRLRKKVRSFFEEST